MAYWCRKALVIRVESPRGEFTRTIDTPFARVGSHRRADVRVEGVPARAYYFHGTETGIFCLPLCADMPGRGWVDEDEAIRCGDSRLWVSFGDQSPLLPHASELDAKLSYGSEVPLWELRHEGRVLARRWQRRPLTLIGRARECHLRIGLSAVSDAHAVSYWDGRHAWIVDLCSTNGTRKKGIRFHAARIRPGRQVALAGGELYFREVARAANGRVPSGDFELGPLPQAERTAASEEPVVEADNNASGPLFGSGSSSVEEDDLADRLAAWEARLLRFERQLCEREAAVERLERELKRARPDRASGESRASDSGPFFQGGLQWQRDDSSVPPSS